MDVLGIFQGFGCTVIGPGVLPSGVLCHVFQDVDVHLLFIDSCFEQLCEGKNANYFF